MAVENKRLPAVLTLKQFQDNGFSASSHQTCRGLARLHHQTPRHLS
jgi:hypothetical protein